MCNLSFIKSQHWHVLCVKASMKWQHELSNLLITHDGTLILLTDQDFEILGIKEENGELDFKVRN